MKSVHYNEDALVITLPTHCPKNLHKLLMHGVNVSLRQSITTTDRRKDDADGLIALSGFLQAILPDELQLQ